LKQSIGRHVVPLRHLSKDQFHDLPHMSVIIPLRKSSHNSQMKECFTCFKLKVIVVFTWKTKIIMVQPRLGGFKPTVMSWSHQTFVYSLLQTNSHVMVRPNICVYSLLQSNSYVMVRPNICVYSLLQSKSCHGQTKHLCL
jgi:hypothetical protein